VAKINFKELLLAKGEKGLLILGAVGLGGLLVWSLATAFGGPDSPSVTAKNLESEAQRILSRVNSDAESPVDPLPDWVTKQSGFVSVDGSKFTMPPPFEPTLEPSKLRDLPPVLTPLPRDFGGGVQLNLIRAPMPAYDVRLENGKVTIGVLSQVKVAANDRQTIKDFRQGVRRAGNVQNLRQQPPQGGPGGAMGGPGGRGMGVPAGPGGGMAGPGGPGMGGPGGPGMGGPGGPGMGGPGGRSGGMGGLSSLGSGPGGYNPNEGRTETFVKYVTPETFDKDPSLVPAVTVYPLRMISVQMAFPLKQQFEEIRKALKLQTLAEAVEASGYNRPEGLFLGLEVERREILPDGTTFEWAKFDHEDIYRKTIMNRKLGDLEDDGYASYFTLPAYHQRLAAPYPILAEGLGGYDTITLNAIAESVERLKAQNKPKYEKKTTTFEGGDPGANPYAPTGGSNLGQMSGMMPGGGIGSMQGPGMGFAPRGGMGGMMQGAPSGGMPGQPGGMPGQPGGPRGGMGGLNPRGAGGQGGFGVPGQPGGGLGSPDGGDPRGGGGFAGGVGQGPAGNPNDPKYYPLNEDFLLLRFLDPEILPGHSYQYRIRIIMRNPNFGKDALVSQPGFAKLERLESPWWTVPGAATIPPETYFYAITPKTYEKKVKEKFERNSAMQELLLPKEGKTVVQIHEWAQEVRLNANAKEPIGTWIVGEVPVGPGEYIGRKHLVQLPTWSAERTAYALKELPGGIKFKPPAKDPPKGWLVDLTTQAVLVDFEGGKFRGQINNNSVQDDADVEMLVVRPDGSVMVRNSATDTAFKPREDRQKSWDEWIKKAEEQGSRLSQPGMGGSGGFGRPGGGTGSPDG
jgi:hypothetical protein